MTLSSTAGKMPLFVCAVDPKKQFLRSCDALARKLQSLTAGWPGRTDADAALLQPGDRNLQHISCDRFTE